jgi:hypothetical protein
MNKEPIPTSLSRNIAADKNALEGVAWRLTGTLSRGAADGTVAALAADALGKPVPVTTQAFLDKERELEAERAALEADREEAMAVVHRADTLRAIVTDLEAKLAHERNSIAILEGSLKPQNLRDFYFTKKATSAGWNVDSQVEIGRWIAGAKEAIVLVKAEVIPAIEKELAQARTELAEFIKREFPNTKPMAA